MNNKSNVNELIEKFLNDVDEKLPAWLKIDPKEYEDVLNELREHIEDKVDELNESGKSYEEAVRLAIIDMGTPTKIANEYKKRGTPKYYITEELWPSYLTTIKYVFSIIAIVVSVLTIIGTTVDLFAGGAWLETLFSGLGSIFTFLLMAFAGVSVLFVWFSMEGYFPDDLKAAMKSREELEKERKRKEQVAQYEKELGKKSVRKMPKGYKEPGELIAGGIFGLIFSILFVWQPFTAINVMMIDEGFLGFLNLLKIFGAFWILNNILQLVQGIVVNWSYVGHKIFMPLRAVLELITLPFWIYLLVNPQLFPIFWLESTIGSWTVHHIIPVFYWVYYLVGIIIVLAIFGTSVHAIYKAAKLREEDMYQ
ncbi:MAG: hypothetical protein GF329_07260 [Candidatus Lokiarchaeota archaeon]|nr:hypothetical protein [Candidatus Lokiarchaeota archaeon]